jgi:hypothetical protein
VGISPQGKKGICERLKIHFTVDMRKKEYRYAYGWLRESTEIHICYAVVNSPTRLKELEWRLRADLKPFYLILNAFKPVF